MPIELSTYLRLSESPPSETGLAVRQACEWLIAAIHPNGWVYDLRRKHFLLAPAARQEMGLPPDGAPVDVTDWLSCRAETDRRASEEIFSHLSNAEVRAFDMIHRVKGANGAHQYLRTMGVHLSDLLPPGEGIAIGIDQPLRRASATPDDEARPFVKGLIVGTADPQGTIRSLYQAASVNAGVVLGSRLEDMVEAPYRPRIARALDRVRTSGAVLTVEARLRHDRSLMLLTCTPMLPESTEAGDFLFAVQLLDPAVVTPMAPSGSSEIEEILMDQHPHLLLEIQPSGICSYANGRARRALGYSDLRGLVAMQIPPAAAMHLTPSSYRWIGSQSPSRHFTVRVIRAEQRAHGRGAVLIAAEDAPMGQALATMHRNLAMERFLFDFSSRCIILRQEQAPKVFDEALSTLGRFANADRAYLYECRDSGTVIENTYEWCRPGVASAKAGYHSVPVGSLSWLMTKFQHHEVVIFHQNVELPSGALQERDMLRPKDARSSLLVPLLGERGLKGFLGFDTVTEPREWHEEDRSLLRLGARIFASAFDAWYHHDQLTVLNESLEERVRQRTLELNRTNAELQALSRTKDGFLAMLGHELRTPLTSIIGYAEALRQETYGPVVATQRSALGMIEASGEYLLQVMNDILDMSHAHAGTMALELSSVKVADVCASAAAMVQPLLAARQVSLTLEPSGTDPVVRADRRRLQQIMVNLLGNAAKFTPPGGWIRVRSGIEPASGRIQIIVADSGIGIPSEELEKIFDPFYQVPQEQTSDRPGVGLGLTVVQQLIKLHGGSISVQSSAGAGSQFSILLPPADQMSTNGGRAAGSGPAHR